VGTILVRIVAAPPTVLVKQLGVRLAHLLLRDIVIGGRFPLPIAQQKLLLAQRIRSIDVRITGALV
jgi:hypothetical protein